MDFELDIELENNELELELVTDQVVVSTPAIAKNSDESVVQQIAPGGSHTFPDIQVFDQNGENPVSFPALKDVQVPDEFNVQAGVKLIPKKSPIFHENMISYNQYDFGWNVANNTYLEKELIGKTQSLDTLGSLVHDNLHGNKFRFTYEDGSEALPAIGVIEHRDFNVVVQDHLTGYEFALIQGGGLAYGFCYGWSAVANDAYLPHLATAPIENGWLGKTGWRTSSTNELIDIGPEGIKIIVNNNLIDGFCLWTNQRAANGRYLFWNVRDTSTYRYINGTLPGSNRNYYVVLIRDFNING